MVAGHCGQARRRTSLPPTRVPRFQKQRVFHLSGRGIDAAAVLGSEDHQFSGLMPRRAVLDMLGLLQDKHSHVTERDKPGAILEHNRAGESRRPSPDGLHRVADSNHRLVSHGVVTADHR
jgi:hypothetical protein